MENRMFCYQCQETAGCSGCTKSGVCGKGPRTAALQDMLVWVTKGISEAAVRLREENRNVPDEVNSRVMENLFITITNGNFDDEAIIRRIRRTLAMKRDLIDCLSGTEGLSEAALWDDAEAMEEKAKGIGVLSTEDEDIRSLRELITYGLKGMAAYLKHAAALERKAENGAVYQADGMRDAEEFLEKALAATLDQNMTVPELTALALETGEYGVKAMAILDEANTSAFGHPEITKVSIGVRKNPGILVSGHDLCDLEQLLEQTEGTGIDVYTHSEMLPAHYYPAFKKYAHFAGNYGNAWWKQKEEFEAFGGPVLLTTNCLVPPKDSYKGRLYTTGAVGYPGCKHIEADADGTKDFTEMINQAKQCPAPVELETGSIVGGFAHNQVLALADPIVEAVKSGAIKKFVVMAGCDGRAPSRNYYTDSKGYGHFNSRLCEI